MSYEVANAEFDRKDTDEESAKQAPPVHQDILPIISNALDLAIPKRKFTVGQPPSGPQEFWVPYYIHTAKCDRCGQHNTSVVQRSSFESKQFCKACMYLNVSDGIYSVNVEGLDWTAQTVSAKRRKPKQPSKLAVAPTSARVSKRKPKELKPRMSKRIRLTEQPESEGRGENSLFVADNGGNGDGEETDDDIGFGRLPPSRRFSSTGQKMSSMESTRIAEMAEGRRPTKGNGQWSENRKEKETENTSRRDINKPELPPWWELTQAPLSSVRDKGREKLWGGNVHFRLIGGRQYEFSSEAVTAADTLLILAQDPREFSIA